MLPPDRPRETHRRHRDGTRYQPLVPVLAAFCVGIAVDRVGEIGWTAQGWAGTSGLLLVVWWWFWRRGRSIASQWLLLASVAALGGAWHHGWWNLFSPYELGLYADAFPHPVVIEGTALGPPRQLPAPLPSPLRSFQLGNRTRLDIRVIRIRDGRQWRRACGWTRVLVDGHLLDVRAGDRLRVVGQLSRPRPATNPGAFDFAAFARGERRLSFVRVSHPEGVVRLSRAARAGLTTWPARIRGWGNRLLWQHLSRPRSGLAAAVLLGAREQLSSDRTEPFVTTGTVHLLVISGLHLGILAGLLLWGMRIGLLPRRAALMLVAVAVVAYAILTDARPPVVRASVLVVILSLAGLIGRRAFAFNSLAAAALVVLALNPTELFRAGSQLSFLAVAALAWLGSRASWQLPWDGPPPTEPLDYLIAQTRPWPYRLAKQLGAVIGNLFLATLVVWLVVAPLVMARFHLLTPITLLLGPLLWLPLAVSLLAGFGVLLFGLIFPPLCGVCAVVCNAGLGALEHCVTWADRLPGSHFWVSGPSDWWLAGFYATMAAALAWPKRLGGWRRQAATLGIWAVIGVAAASCGDGRQRLRCTFLSVGHGCAVVVQLPGGQALLYDVGCLGSPLTAARAVSGCLWARGVRRLDAVVLSHADLDHYNGLPELLRRFPVEAVYTASDMRRSQAPGVTALRQALAAHHVPWYEIAAGDRLPLGAGAGRVDVLHPPPAGIPAGDNANSVVLLIEFADRRLLLSGDLEPPGVDRLLAGQPVDCDVLLAPHHGSRHSAPQVMARWCRPETVVISGGPRDQAADVERAFRQIGAAVFHTARAGAVRLEIDRQGRLEWLSPLVPQPPLTPAVGHPAL